MINIVDCNTSELNDRLQDRSIVCFGAGVFFQRFIEQYGEIVPSIIIDNYVNGYRDIGKTRVQIGGIEKLKECLNCEKDVAIVITSSHSGDILEQLNALEYCNGIAHADT